MTSLLFISSSFASSCTFIFAIHFPPSPSFPFPDTGLRFWQTRRLLPPGMHAFLFPSHVPALPSSRIHNTVHDKKLHMSRKFFFVFAEASVPTITSAAVLFLTDFSVMNSPLAVRPALVASPSRENTLFGFTLTKLLFQAVVNLIRNTHLEGTLQSAVLSRLFQAVQTFCTDRHRVRSSFPSHPARSVPPAS